MINSMISMVIVLAATALVFLTGASGVMALVHGAEGKSIGILYAVGTFTCIVSLCGLSAIYRSIRKDIK